MVRLRAGMSQDLGSVRLMAYWSYGKCYSRHDIVVFLAKRVLGARHQVRGWSKRRRSIGSLGAVSCLEYPNQRTGFSCLRFLQRR